MEEYIPSQEYELALRLRVILFSAVADAKERFSYNAPFYFRKKRFAYIWPGSIPFGNGSPNEVILGFINGKAVASHFPEALFEHRKSVAIVRCSKKYFPNESTLIEMLSYAALKA